MKFNALIILLATIIFLPISACKKEAVYPDDIPQWLKDKIEAFHEETRKYKDGCKEENCIIIKEYKLNEDIIYMFSNGPEGDYVYSISGDEQCYYDRYQWHETDSVCGYIGNPAYYKLNRLIWQEK